MKILIDIGHPAHIHLLKNLYFKLKEDGHTIFITVKNIKVQKDLLEKYNMKYINIGDKKDSLMGKALSQIIYNLKILKLVLLNRIELGIGNSMTIPHISRVSKMKSILIDDDDDNVQELFVKYAHPFADCIISPTAVIENRANKSTIFHNSYHELAYLHPNNFTPDKSVLSELGLSKGEKFFIMRFNVFKAFHDVGMSGLNLKQKLKLVELLKEHGKIFITTEREIEPELKEYQLTISPDKIHSLMYYSSMFIGDSQTMASEASILGVPSIRCNDFAGKISYLNEQESKYGLTYAFKPDNFNNMLLKIQELLDMKNLKGEWEKRHKKMINDKIDLTLFLIWFVENYPTSVEIMQQDSSYQELFRREI
jgi:predicted glycosyltransferase